MRTWGLVFALLVGCSDGDGTPAASVDTGTALDTATPDTAVLDTASVDAAADDTRPSDSSPADTKTDSATVDAPADTPGDPFGATYPAGPYGINKGETLANLDWEGYVNDKADAISTTKPYVKTSLDQLRRKGNYGVIHIADFT